MHSLTGAQSLALLSGIQPRTEGEDWGLALGQGSVSESPRLPYSPGPLTYRFPAHQSLRSEGIPRAMLMPLRATVSQRV